MLKPRIVVVDPSGEGRAAVSSVLRFRRWSATQVAPADVAGVPPDVDLVLAVETTRGDGSAALRQVRRAGSQAAITPTPMRSRGAATKVVGSVADNETDTQQFIFPIILPLMLAIYVGFFSVFSNPNGPIAVAFSIFPLTSSIVMMMRLPGGIGEGGVPLWQLLTSIALLIATFLAIVWLAAKIYRVGILMYGKKPTYKELYKWLKY